MKFVRKSASHRLLLFGVRAAVCLTVLLLVGVATSALNSQQLGKDEHKRVRRSIPNIAETDNDTKDCVTPGIEEFPADFFTEEQREEGGVVIHVLIMLYMLAALSVVCDDYFVAALEKICERLNLSPDVAGATFMASGSSAPELFTSIIGVFIAKSDVGLGTIVGSAVFNILFIVAICALAAGSSLKLSWYPLTRDSLYYLISVIAIILVIMDGKVYWYEGMSLLIMYVIYIVIMYFNTRMEVFIHMMVGLPVTRPESHEEERTPFARKEEKSRLEVKGEEETDIDGRPAASKRSDDDDDDEEESVFDIPNSLLKRSLWVGMLPASVLMYFTIPDCRRKRFQNFYILTFIMSIVWIAATSYVVVWMVSIVGYTAGIPDSIMGLTFLAAGTSMPEVISGIIVTRAGEGDMAISNSIGSNVFDLLICLGLPWFISSAITNPGVPVPINSSGLTYSAAVLLSTVVILIAGTKLNKWRLTPTYGVILLVIWVVVTVFMCLFELNIFGDFRPPTCKFD